MGAFVKGVRVSINLLFVSFQHVTLLAQTLNMMVKKGDSTKSLCCKDFCMFKGLLDFRPMKAATRGCHNLALFVIKHCMSPLSCITRNEDKDVEYPVSPLNYLQIETTKFT